MNKELPTINNFRDIAINNTPLIDVRAPIEFEKGAFLGSCNLPLMNNKERELVGTCYKEKGHEKAVELGHSLVNGKVKEERVNTWLEFIKQNPDSYLYCFRGGERSQISQRWIKDAGIDISRLEGGYKAFRSYLMEQLETITLNKEVFIIGGTTGSGKTILLKKLKESIDLEKIANHRGSSFGHHVSSQPTQINFENNLAYAFIQHDAKALKRLIVEDESMNIGRCYIPKPLFTNLQKGKLILLETPLEQRVDITYNEYILESQQEYTDANNAYGWIENMQNNFNKIKRRLGDKRHKEFTQLLNSANKHQLSTNDPTQHKIWIEKLLNDYYDPMYNYQIKQKEDLVAFKGTFNEILEYLYLESDSNTTQ